MVDGGGEQDLVLEVAGEPDEAEQRCVDQRLSSLHVQYVALRTQYVELKKGQRTVFNSLLMVVAYNIVITIAGIVVSCQ